MVIICLNPPQQVNRIKHEKEVRGGKMEISFLVKIAADEEKAERFLREKGVLKTLPNVLTAGINTLERLGEAHTNATNVKENGAQRKGAYLKDQGYHTENFCSF